MIKQLWTICSRAVNPTSIWKLLKVAGQIHSQTVKQMHFKSLEIAFFTIHPLKIIAIKICLNSITFPLLNHLCFTHGYVKALV